jgi:hypothetical protein
LVKLKDTFRKLAMVSAVFPMLALGGCAGGLPSQTLQTDVANIESQVQADADVICGFIPTAATIAAFIPSFGAVAASASVIAEGVCNAIAKAPVVQPAAARMRANLAASGADVQVATARTPNGVVPIVGHFTR